MKKTVYLIRTTGDYSIYQFDDEKEAQTYMEKLNSKDNKFRWIEPYVLD